MSLHISTLSRPALHALLNGTAALALSVGFAAIRAKRIGIHRAAMGTAFMLSVIFLGSYLEYHARVGATRFQGTGLLRILYLSILASHTVLAALVVPLVLLTLGFALKGNFDRHRRWARWTWPVWMYVCVTGVGIFFFLKYGQP